ncbi:hypothetical protein ACVMIL_004566 [Bradyrhizobium barranii subsp. barranii]
MLTTSFGRDISAISVSKAFAPSGSATPSRITSLSCDVTVNGPNDRVPVAVPASSVMAKSWSFQTDRIAR